MFKVFANCTEKEGPTEVAARAERAESMGYFGLHVPDALHDGLLLSAMALNATDKLVVGTGVLLAFPRSPMTTAVACWDLQHMSKGRFELGLGTQIKSNIEKRYSARWDSPVPQMREYIQSIKAVFHSFQTGEPLHFEGQHYSLTKLQPFFNPGPIEHPDIPILAGAVGPAMTKMVARIADGMITHPTNTPPEYIRQICLPRLQAGFDKAERDPSTFKLVLGPLSATGKNEEIVAAQWEIQRNRLGFLFSTPAYWPTLELFGWQDKGQQLLEMTRAGDWGAMSNIINDDMMEKIIPRGTYANIASVYQDWYSGLTDRITFPMPDDPRDDILAAEVIHQLQDIKL